MYVIGILKGILRSEDFLIIAFDLQTNKQKSTDIHDLFFELILLLDDIT